MLLDVDDLMREILFRCLRGCLAFSWFCCGCIFNSGWEEGRREGFGVGSLAIFWGAMGGFGVRSRELCFFRVFVGGGLLRLADWEFGIISFIFCC